MYPVIIPFVIVAVAVAVVPTPTPIVGGAEIEIGVVDPTYPRPPPVIVSAEIVPQAPTVAVNPAATAVSSLIIKPPTLLITREDQSSS